ncbi:MAG: AraC family transcriptional regulator [Hungatella sp.]
MSRQIDQIREKLYRNKRNFHRLLIIFLSTIFIASVLFLYGQFQTATIKTLVSFNSDFTERVNATSNTILNNIKTSAMQMFYTSSITNLRMQSELTNAEEAIAFRDLGNFVSSSDFLDSVMIYSSRSDKVYTSEGSESSALSSDFHDAEAVEILTHPENHPFLTPIKRSSSKGFTYSFLFFEYRNADSSALLVNINEAWYTSQLLGISENNDYIVVDALGNLIASENDSLHREVSRSWSKIQQQLILKPTEGFFMPSAFSADPGWMYHRMKNSDWYYLRPIQMEVIAPGLVYIQDFLVISFFLLAAVLIIFTIYLLLKVYLPLQYIRMALAHGDQSKENILVQVEELVTHQQENKIVQYMNDLNTGILPPAFTFPIIMVIAQHSPCENLSAIAQSLSPSTLTLPTETGALLAISSCSDHTIEQLRASLGSDHHGYFYISDLCYTSEDLIKSHLALEELVHLHFLHLDQTITCESMLNQCNPISSLKTKEVSVLITALKGGHADTAFLQWQSIFSCIREDRFADFCFALQYIGKQLNNLQAELGMTNRTDADALLEDPKDALEIHAYMETLLNQIAESAKQKKQQQLTILADQIDAYIAKHYAENSFSPQQIAEHFQMNAAYLSRQYQQITEQSISDAIHQVRMAQACILLSHTDASAELIAQRVGYDNVKYFFVLFKKRMGCTPKQYRNVPTPPS